MSQPPISPQTRYFQLADYNKGLCIAFIIVNVFAVGVRVWARRRQKLPLLLDDWLIIPALILTIASATTMIKSIELHAMGYPVPRPASQVKADLDASLESVHIVSKTEFAMNLLIIPALSLIKLSFLAFYKRIFCVNKLSAVRYGINGMMILIIVWTVAYWFAHLFMCGTNFNAFWSSFEDLRTKCIDTFKMLYSFCITDFITDALILIIPLLLLWRLQLSPIKKAAVTAVFLLGSGAVAASATRLAFAVKAINQGFTNVDDGNLMITGMMSWFQLEAFLGILAACLPTVRFLFKGLSPESVIDSIRSALSLHSLRSNHSAINDDGTRLQQAEEGGSKVSHINVVSNADGIEVDSGRYTGSTEV